MPKEGALFPKGAIEKEHGTSAHLENQISSAHVTSPVLWKQVQPQHVLLIKAEL